MICARILPVLFDNAKENGAKCSPLFIGFDVPKTMTNTMFPLLATQQLRH